MRPTEIVLTGGPCSGKTTARNYLQDRLSALPGVRPFFVPEVATMIISGGVPDVGRLAAHDQPRFFELERHFLRTQRALRERFLDLATLFPEDRCVVIYDRAETDILAYLGRERFMALLEEERLTLADVRDSYDAAIHLVTAADGAEAFYTTVNNTARRETAAEARAMDALTQAAWTGHPHLRVIDNSTDFEGKLSRVFQAVSRVMGIPVPVEIERKYLLRRAPDFTLPEFSTAQRIEIEQSYLRSSDPSESVRIRRRSQHGHATYYLTRKTSLGAGIRQETEQRISASEYLALMAQRDPARQPVRKDRWCFLWRGQYLELDIIHEPASRACVLLEIELTEQNDRVEIPPFLEVERDVTEEPAYANQELARG